MFASMKTLTNIKDFTKNRIRNPVPAYHVFFLKIRINENGFCFHEEQQKEIHKYTYDRYIIICNMKEILNTSLF